MLNPLAAELNAMIQQSNVHVAEMLSELGTKLFFPKGIITQSAEANEKATRFNATIGTATEQGHAMYLDSIMKQFPHLQPDEILPYAPSPGNAKLRQLWGQELQQKNPSLAGRPISTPVVTSGVTHGLSLVGELFVDPGDTILVSDMFWGNYSLIFGLRQKATLKTYPLFGADGGFDCEGFRQTLKCQAEGKSKLLVLLNFPNNPTGYSITNEEGEAICQALCEVADSGCNLVVLSDDAYFGLFFEENIMRESLFAKLAHCHERILAVKLDGATKEDFVWGFRIGFVTFGNKGANQPLYTALEKKIGAAIRGNVSNCSNLSQTVVLKAMQDPAYNSQKEQKFQTMRSRAAKVKEVLAQSKFDAVWKAYPFNSGYFMCVKLNDLNAEAYRVKLLESEGIGVISSGQHDIRVAFSCIEVEDIPELFERMYQCALAMSK